MSITKMITGPFYQYEWMKINPTHSRQSLGFWSFHYVPFLFFFFLVDMRCNSVHLNPFFFFFNL